MPLPAEQTASVPAGVPRYNDRYRSSAPRNAKRTNIVQRPRRAISMGAASSRRAPSALAAPLSSPPWPATLLRPSVARSAYTSRRTRCLLWIHPDPISVEAMMIRRIDRLFSLFASTLVALAFHGAAAAAPLQEEQAAKVREVIVQQISALQEDDAERAFQTATPAVQAAIGSSMRFLAMVRGAYPMVYRPSSVSFHKPEAEEGSVLQLVEIRDTADKSWLALFALEEQPDKTWRISGCVVAENPWQSI
jgi:hypothetical protein